jgi:hypothetical protein
MLLTERLYYRQVAQASQDTTRLTKVKKTMAHIKLVLSERSRAAQLYEADVRRSRQVEEAVGRAASGAVSVADAVQAVLAPKPEAAEAASGGAAGSSSAAVPKDPVLAAKEAARAEIRERLKEVRGHKGERTRKEWERRGRVGSLRAAGVRASDTDRIRRG